MNAVRRIDGMEWLAELEEDQAADADFYRPGHDGEPVGGRLYLVMSNRAALDEMVRLWRAYQTNPEQPLVRGFNRWRRLFERLRDLRFWGVQDRLRETGLAESWNEDIAAGRDTVSFEAELWFRHAATARERASAEVSQAIRDAGGEVRQEYVHEGIEYHALLGRIPSGSVEQILGATPLRLVQLDEVMFFRPVGQSISVAPDEPPLDNAVGAATGTGALGQPRIALLDGLPLSNHAVLDQRLVIDDPQGWEQGYQAGERIHGTEMASLIVNGDLSSEDAPLARPLYVRPIMRPDPNDFNFPRAERMPFDQLAVDLLHSAVRRICEGEGGQPPVAPEVRIVNLSIGDPNRPLDGPMSPFGRMIDWLSWRYKVLFMVSAGNAHEPVDLGVTRTAVGTMTADQLRSSFAQSIHARAHLQRIISPAESVNALTVGSLHEDDSSAPVNPPNIDPYPGPGFPSPINRLGLGFRRSVKPDVLFEGGVQVYRLSPTSNQGVLNVARTGGTGPGQRVAAPGLAGNLRAVRYTCGTSNATAIGSRAGDSVLEMLSSLRTDWSPAEASLLAKVLIGHASSWSSAADVLRTELAMGSDYKEHLARYLGYGVVQLDRVLSCTASRVTVLSSSSIADDEGHLYRLPLPPSLSGLVGIRRLIVTLAWFTPINPLHRAYRRAGLWVGKPESGLVMSRQDVQWQTVQRGTLQHDIFEGDAAVGFIDGAEVQVKVNCRADAGRLDDQVPYALAVTLETDEGLRVPVYEEVAERLQIRAGVRV